MADDTSDSKSSNRGILLESGTNEVEFLQFSIEGQRYGINVSKVRQILSLTNDMITPLPNGSPSICGVTYFRDKPCPVINLHKHLGGAVETQENLRPLLIMTEINQKTVGYLIDEVHEIVRITWKEFKPMESTIFNHSNTSVVGCVTHGQHLILILDFESMLAELIPSTSIERCAGQVTTRTDNARSSINIIYCEDSTIVQKLMMNTLTKAGFEKVTLFPSGIEGLQYLNSPNHAPVDIILSDIEMPRMDGLSFCKELRGLPEYKDTPVIFFSSMISDEMKSKCKAVGGTAAFSKPEIHKIVEHIDGLITKE